MLQCSWNTSHYLLDGSVWGSPLPELPREKGVAQPRKLKQRRTLCGYQCRLLSLFISVQDKKKLFKLRYCQTTTEAFINQTKLKSGIHDLRQRELKGKCLFLFKLDVGDSQIKVAEDGFSQQRQLVGACSLEKDVLPRILKLEKILHCLASQQ